MGKLDTPMRSRCLSIMRIENVMVRECMAEFLGTFILMLFGNASVAQSVLTNKVYGDIFAVNWAWGIAVILGITVSGGISGGHINPAVTLAFAVWGRHPWIKVPGYMLCQYAGAFVASFFVFVVYLDALNHYEPTRTLATAGIWATYPGQMTNVNGTIVKDFLSMGNGFGDQVLGTAALLLCVCAIVDKRNMEIPKYLMPLMVGLLVLNMGNSFAFNCGCALNPARDLAPRIFSMIAGWGEDPFTAGTNEGIPWWWVPIIATHVGAIVGVGIYELLIEMHHPQVLEISTVKVSPIDATDIKIVSRMHQDFNGILS